MRDLGAAAAAAITQLWMDYGAAFGRGDVAALAELYAPDGDMIAVDGEHVAGRDAIADYYRRQLAGRFQGVTLQDVQLLPPRWIARDVAVMNATWMVHGLQPDPFRVRTTFVVTRDSSGWRFAAVRFAAALQAGAASSG